MDANPGLPFKPIVYISHAWACANTKSRSDTPYRCSQRHIPYQSDILLLYMVTLLERQTTEVSLEHRKYTYGGFVICTYYQNEVKTLLREQNCVMTLIKKIQWFTLYVFYHKMQ